MKKAAVLLIVSMLVPVLSGCENKPNELVYIPYGQLYDKDIDKNGEVDLQKHLTLLSNESFENKIKEKDSFFLVSYDKNSDSESISKFKTAFSSYLEISNAPAFYVAPGSNGITLTEGEASLFLYKEGKKLYSRETKGKEDSFNSLGGITSWMDERASISDMLYLNESQLDCLFEGKDQFTVGFIREGCQDCIYLKENVLYDYNKSHNNASYIIDCDYLSEGFKDKYGLTASSNEDYGYETGYVPTFVRYAPTKGAKAEAIVDAAVYLNDTVSFVDGEYKVTKSYYSDTRKELLGFFGNSVIKDEVLEGKTLNEESVTKVNDNLYVWKRNEAAKYHDPIIKAFLDAYVSIK